MNLYLDIETLPTDREDIIAEIEAGISAPGQYKKPEAIAEWLAENKESAAREAIHKTGLDGGFGRVCVIGYALDDGNVATYYGDEREIIYDFFDHIDDGRRLKVIGHNVGFDIRFLWQRAKVLGIKHIPSWWPVTAKPWDTDALFDTMTAWAGVGQRVSLDKMCRVFRLNGKGDMDGSKVWEYWQAGRHDEVAAYCAQDVERVREIYQRIGV